jgi:hypothetical protein
MEIKRIFDLLWNAKKDNNHLNDYFLVLAFKLMFSLSFLMQLFIFINTSMKSKNSTLIDDWSLTRIYYDEFLKKDSIDEKDSKDKKPHFEKLPFKLGKDEKIEIEKIE